MQQQDLLAIGGRVQYIRRKHGYTYRSLAEETGLHFNTVSGVEKGKGLPPLALLTFFQEKHGYSIDWILYNKGREQSGTIDKDSSAALKSKVFKMEKELKALKALVQEILRTLDEK
jgi:transcriptional regulator with XRE-family HTH domain